MLVERVENLCSKHQWRRAYKEINDFEAMLAADDVKIVKIFLHITSDEQLRRFEARVNDPLKRWKLTFEDIRNRKNWAAYEDAVDDMIARTTTGRAPWHVVPANDKKYGRIEAFRLIVEGLNDGLDLAPPPLDPEVARAARLELGLDTRPRLP